MKWLTLKWIKKHSRIDFDCEDDLLELYGESAEDTVLNVIARDYTEVIEHYGEVPKPLFVAALMLVEVSYTQRAPITQQNIVFAPGAGKALAPIPVIHLLAIAVERHLRDIPGKRRRGPSAQIIRKILQEFRQKPILLDHRCTVLRPPAPISTNGTQLLLGSMQFLKQPSLLTADYRQILPV